MTRKQAEQFAQAEANMLKTRVYVRLDKVEPAEEYSVSYSYDGMIDTPSYRDPE